jgi:predicted N-acetyltransferase YhbS
MEGDLREDVFLRRMEKMEKGNGEVRRLGLEDLPDDALKSFDRFQLTERVRRRDLYGHVIKDTRFTDDWDEEEKVELVRSLRRCLEKGGCVAGAFMGGVLLGFASVEPGSFGRRGEYLQLANLHVSREARHRGIGKRLFMLCVQEAKRMGARKLYISAHSAEETQQFYESVGCVDAKEVNPVLAALEPYDIQLEYDLEGENRAPMG